MKTYYLLIIAGIALGVCISTACCKTTNPDEEFLVLFRFKLSMTILVSLFILYSYACIQTSKDAATNQLGRLSS